MTTEKQLMEMEQHLSEMAHGFMCGMDELIDEFQDLMRLYISSLRDIYMMTEELTRELGDIIFSIPEG